MAEAGKGAIFELKTVTGGTVERLYVGVIPVVEAASAVLGQQVVIRTHVASAAVEMGTIHDLKVTLAAESLGGGTVGWWLKGKALLPDGRGWSRRRRSRSATRHAPDHIVIVPNTPGNIDTTIARGTHLYH